MLLNKKKTNTVSFFDFLLKCFTVYILGSISTALSTPVFVPLWGRAWSHFPEQRLVIEPIYIVVRLDLKFICEQY